MARYSGVIGYDMGQVQTAPGVWTANIVERKLKGEVKRDTRQVLDGEYVNSDISLQNVIEVVADDYARENYHAIRYAMLNGVRWKVDSVEVRRPRLILRLGRRYNGKIPAATP